MELIDDKCSLKKLYELNNKIKNYEKCDICNGYNFKCDDYVQVLNIKNEYTRIDR